MKYESNDKQIGDQIKMSLTEVSRYMDVSYLAQSYWLHATAALDP